MLLVDDEPDILRAYSDILDSEGYAVSTACSGEDALVRAESEHPDLVVMDVKLPGRNGIETAREMGRRETLCRVPVVMITALEEFPTGAGLSEIENIRGFIYKPCRPETLVEGVEHALNP